MNRAATDRLQRALIGFLLAAALFLVEAGWSELAMARNRACEDELRTIRLAPDPRSVCASELETGLAVALSRGPFEIFSSTTPNATAWLVMGSLYGLLGGAFAQISPRYALPGFLVSHLLLVIGFMLTGYLAQFIA